jgi:flavin-dependent dehydrogenase
MSQASLYDVLLLEKHRFPRDKVCGDALCTRAQVHLERMGTRRARPAPSC